MKLLLHICCGPCATASIRKMQRDGYEITGFYYNPNIHPSFEYKKRLKEARKLADEMNINLVEETYQPKEYFRAIKGKELSFGERCVDCWKLRLARAADYAQTNGFTHLATTLRISPYQNQEKLLGVAKEISREHNLIFYEAPLTECFRESVSMSKERGMYRQKYCGCIFSREYR